MATIAMPAATAERMAGGSFLIVDAQPSECFFPEDFTEEHRQVAAVTAEFAANEVLPASAAIEAKDFAVTRRLIREASELGLTSVDTPEQYGGLAMDKVTSAIVAENIAVQGSFSVSFAAHVGIGTLPIVWYGTEAQKGRYLPKLATGEWIGAYALSESSSGSDALHARTRAVLSEDGSSYVLNGEKMWISNAGFADVFTVFAMCSADGKGRGDAKLTAFLVERGTPGFAVGKEEHKLGIRGSSTCPLILTDCRIPAGNLLGEVGKGHRIAFNILNMGRYKLGAATVGAAKQALLEGVRYAKERKAFGKAICEFGLIQEKLADCAASIFAGEAMCYRTIGMIDAALEGVDAADVEQMQKRIEEYAVECSIAKVWGSEMLDGVVDHVVQIFGGYGYVEEYPAERAYRDSRVNRIFEGTNEINRMIVTGWMVKSAMSGKLALLPAIQGVMDGVMAGPGMRDELEGPMAAERALVRDAKKMTLFAAGAATQRYGAKLAEEQEVMGSLADMMMEVYVLESAVLRAQKMASARSTAMARLYAVKSFARVELAGRRVVAAAAEGDALRTQMTILRRMAKHDPADTVALGREVAQGLLRAGRYGV